MKGATCRPNIGAAGRRHRRTFAVFGGVAAIALLCGMIAFGLGWEWRLLVGLPASAAFVSELQVQRNTCVGLAFVGLVEDEDFRTTKADAAHAKASRWAAATILRDGVLGAVVCALLSAATAVWV